MVIGEAVGMTDVAIIGAGPGGYVAAIRLAELGKSVTIIDRESVGGICLHHGCIPAKALIHAAQTYREIEKSKDFGVSASGVRVDFKKVQEWKAGIVKRLDDGIRALLRHHKVQLIKANAFFESSNRLALRPIEGHDDEHLDINALEYKKCIIASGSAERMLPGVEVDGKHIMEAWHAIELTELPKSLLIIGGGYIGVELSQMFAKLGVKVTIVEALPSILSLLDDECSDVVKKQLESLGTVIHCNAKVESCKKQGDHVKTAVTLQDGTGRTIATEKTVVAIGRVAETAALQLDNTKVQLDPKGFITVTNKMQTHDARIFAIGDVVGGVMLAHKASYEGKIAAEVIAGKRSAFDNLVPYGIFSDPEIAGVGLTEKEAKQKGIQYRTARFSMSGLGKAAIMGVDAAQGFFKVLHDNDKNILGVHIAGPRAVDMIGEAVLAMEMGATIEDLSLIIHPHPSLIEGFGEVADVGIGLPTNTL